MKTRAASGISGLDEILHGLNLGDNVVWQIDHIEDYQRFVRPFVEQALADHRRVVYLRFADHPPLLQTEGVVVHSLNAYRGFESFSHEIHTIITREGRGVYYVFDCLSDLLTAWATDQMVGNFFRVTCPYLYELDTVAYFAIERNRHSYNTVARIRETTQLLLDLYCCEGHYYLHPLKVWNRYSPTMFLPHRMAGEKFEPITSSADTTMLFNYICHLPPESARRRLDYWDLLFMEAEEQAQQGVPLPKQQEMFTRLCRVIFTSNPRMQALLQQYFSLADVLAIKSRIVGTGFIGGKAVGMLLARNILRADKAAAWGQRLEPHDSFYIGSDVFYTYIVHNGDWKLWMQQKTPEGYFSKASALGEKILKGEFPQEICERFQQVIEYFGQAPIIVRSSSLLEDSFESAFAGKYESIFLTNQGSSEERYERFLEAIRHVYASTMSMEALEYRQQRGLEKADEQMALLVQRVSGAQRKNYFYPFCAGVGVSYNTFVWGDQMDPKAGMIRLVLGLGTRAVNRVEGDYPRIVALDAPHLRPYVGMRDAKAYSQHEVDILDLQAGTLATVPFAQVARENPELPLELVAVADRETMAALREAGREVPDLRILTFDELLSRTDLVPLMLKLMKTLEEVYQYPVDVEFTLNLDADKKLWLNLLQCRPLQTRGIGRRVEIPSAITPAQTVFRSVGRFAGGNIIQPVRRIIHVDPQAYAQLGITEKYSIARLVGKLNHLISEAAVEPTMLIGPGRWGTSTPSLGVPASFAEINRMTVLVEVAFTSGQLMPELSFGSHFFQDLVETGIFYAALYPEEENVMYHPEWFTSRPNLLPALLPDQAPYAGVVGVYNTSAEDLRLITDVVTQDIICFAAE